MSYSSQQSHSQNYSQSMTQSSSIGVLANVADHQERKYRSFIQQNEAIGTGIATRLAKGTHFETIVGSEFTQECREKLKALASDNVTKARQLKAYVSAIRVVIAQAEQGNTQENEDPNNNNNNNNTNEFKEQMETEYAKAMETISANSVKVTQEASYLELCKTLGENNDEDEDDELAVVNDGGSSNSSSKIKCPLTMAFMEDPVRSKVCKHSFGRDAIYHYLRTSNTQNRNRNGARCPVPGCINGSMTINELEEDPETKMRVRRHKKRESASRRQLAQSAINGDDDEDDDEHEFTM